MEQKKLKLASQIENEISDYFSRDVSISGDITFSQPKLIRRISLFESRIYPNGKFDSQGNYKFWFDVITPRVEAEIKNIDFDTKDVEIYSPRRIDEIPSLLTNLKLAEYLRDTGQAEKFNSAIEEGSGWGNVVWKKVKGTYERVDLKNFYAINQTAENLSQSPVIERHQLTQTELREKSDIFKNVEEIIKTCGQNIYKSDVDSVQQEVTTPIYSVYERNGEVNLKDLKEFKKEEVEKDDDKKYVFAKVIAAGSEGTGGGVKIKYIAYAEELKGKNNSNIYKEYHRGRYKGRWWREGLYELLFDVQVRANEIGNQLAQGLVYSSKTIFRSKDKLVVQNILTDLKNGDIIRSEDLQQVQTRMEGFDQLVADWNRIINLANEIANSREIIQGGGLPSGTPFRLGALLNINANKLFDFIREKISIPLREIFEEWIVPDLIKNISAQEILRLTGDSEMLQRMRELVVLNWYLNNLIAIGPHSPEIAEFIKSQKMEEIGKKAVFLKEFKKVFENFKPRVSVVITGENVAIDEKLQTLATFIQLEQDPVRRSFLVEKAMRMKGVDVGELPRSTPEQLSGQPRAQEGAVESPMSALMNEAVNQ